jgi:predicted enzyme related to lactoylglutathione lyase
MAEGAMWQHGHFYWNELMTRDPEGAKAFYGAEIGWRFDSMAMPKGGTYWICKDGDQPVAGILDMNLPGFEGIPNHWFAYLAVDDVDARVEKARAAGAQLLRPIFDVPGVGRIAILKDPAGAGLGWITPTSE